MLFKLITILGALIALGVFLIRAVRGSGPPGRRPRLTARSGRRPGAPPAEMVPCPECGAYREVGSLCACERAPLP